MDLYGADGRIHGRTADGVQEWSFGLDDTPPSLTPTALIPDLTAIDIMIPPDGGDALLIVADAASQGIVFIESDGTEYEYDVGSAPRSVYAQFDPAHTGVGDPDLIVTYVDGGGDPWMLIVDIRPPAFEQYELPVGFTANQALAWPTRQGPMSSWPCWAAATSFGIAER